ncbi:AIPR family protein [Gammaproteobacteria bacterium]|nr:AIPR family protein [Gammaproteobacteria bacterium]
MADFKQEELENFIKDVEASVNSRRILIEADTDSLGFDDGIPALVTREEALTEEFIERLSGIAQIPDMHVLSFEGTVGRGKAKTNAYFVSDDEEELHLAVTVQADKPGRRVPARDIESAAKRALRAFLGSKKPHHENIDASRYDVRDMFIRLHEIQNKVNVIRIHVLINGTATNLSWGKSETTKSVQLEVWDYQRLYRISSSGRDYESLDINLLDYLNEPVPCISSDLENQDYKVNLALLPGELLYRLYERYGARLMELNVRSFLQARNKVNRGIRDTLASEAANFLAYNNGISITVDELGYAKRKDGTVGIARIKGMQIVNGGQTTASIHRAKARDNVDLTDVRVQAKITEIQPQNIEELAKNISRYSNAQTAVNLTDFSANDPFHIKLQQLSETVFSPGELHRWFYERARGQYETARNREGTTPARLKAFDSVTPKKQKFDKTSLVKVENSWRQKPDWVAKGTQKNFENFMASLDKKDPDEIDYKNIIARQILYKNAESIARKLAFPAYRANVVSYTVALLSYRTLNRINLAEIWSKQAVPQEIETTLHEWMPRVFDTIVESAGGRNVTEWAKNSKCWAVVQALDVHLSDKFLSTLNEGTALPNVGAYRDGNAMVTLSNEEIERQQKVMAMSADALALLFKETSQYMNNHGMRYMEWQSMTGAMSTVQIYAENNWEKIPTPKQTKQIIKAVEFTNARRDRAS